MQARSGVAGPIIPVAVLVALAALPLAAQPKGPWMDKSLSADQRADLVLARLTLDEKIGLVHGSGWAERNAFNPAARMLYLESNGGAGYVPGIPRLGIPGLQMADSAYGVTHGADKGRYSTALPSNIAEASSWDPKLAHDYGALIGRELRDQGYNMSLAGGVNLAREPRNGRNFEYQGEDPILAGTMVGEFIRGLQEQGVIGDIKHYALNDQETGRRVGNAKLDRRSLRETDLLAFEIGVKQGQPGAVMCSYNRINGDFACENSYTLTDVLKNAWGFPGFVVSDWEGTESTTKAALSGLDLEMPGDIHFGQKLKEAVERGEVPLARLNDMVHRILRSEFACGIIDNPPRPQVSDVFAGLALAQRVAEQGIVLLKNSGGLLPLSRSVKSIALIGSHADVGVLSGAGSAQVDPPGGNAVHAPGKRGDAGWQAVVWYPSSPLQAIRALAPNANVEFNDGTDPASAAALAKASKVAIVFVNQPTSEERDEPSLTLPGRQNDLVNAVRAANPRTIVVLETGGPVAMPWADKVSAILEAWYPGIRGAEALANILFGVVNPSAKLPATFARSDADLPHPQIAGMSAAARLFDIDYTEGLKVGYKWFDAEDKQPLFGFGEGLSYTTFAYSGLKATANEVSFIVKNTGKRAGAEIAEIYAGLPQSANEPPKRLVAWDKVQLAPGGSRTVTVKLDPMYLSIFSVEKNDWELLPGDYTIFVGGSSRFTPLAATVRLGENNAVR